MKKLKFFSILLLASMLLAMSAPALATEQPTVQSSQLALIDIGTGNVLFSKDADAKAYPAAASQIMTVLLAVEAIENGKAALSDAVTVTADGLSAAVSDDAKTVAFSVGETTTLENLLYAAMLTSSTDACAAIAQHISGGTTSFVAAMNARAKELGCTGTNFTNVGGTQDINHYTTAADLAKIARAAYGHSIFMQICNSLSRTIPATNASDERQLSNANGLLNPDVDKYGRYYYQYAAGMKAGSTAEAGYCLVSSASRDGIKLICVVLGGKAVAENSGTAYTNYADTQTLYNWAFDSYEYREVIKQTENVRDVAVKMGRDAETVAVHPEASVKVLVPKDEDVSDFTQKITIYSEQEGQSPLTAPVEAGTVLGEITAVRDGQAYGTAKLLASNSVDLSYSLYLRERMKKTLLTPGAFAFFAVVVFLIVWYCTIVARYKRRVRDGLIPADRPEPEPLPEPDPFAEFEPETDEAPDEPSVRGRKAKKEKKTKAEKQPDTPKPARQPKAPKRQHAAAGRHAPEAEQAPDPEKQAEDQAERDYFAEFFGNKLDK